MVDVTGCAVCSRRARPVTRLTVLDTRHVDVCRQPARRDRRVARRALRLDDMRRVVEQRPGHDRLGHRHRRQLRTRQLVAFETRYEQRFQREALPLAVFRMFVLLATDGSRPVQIGRLRQVVARLDAQVPIRDVVWFDDLLAEGAAQTRFVTLILSALGLVSLIVALLGIYGILAVSVATRTREMGIRIALGASSRTVVRVFLGEALVLGVVGALAGLVVFLASGRVLTALLVGVESAHVPTLVGVAGPLVLAALGAAYIPALRASRADPLTVIRAD